MNDIATYRISPGRRLEVAVPGRLFSRPICLRLSARCLAMLLPVEGTVYRYIICHRITSHGHYEEQINTLLRHKYYFECHYSDWVFLP